MPDMRIMIADAQGNVNIQIPFFDDSISGIEALAQTVALMLLDPSYGNLESLLKQRIDRSDVGEIILRAVDNTERIMLDEQAGKVLDDSEVLVSLDILSITISNDKVAISLRVINKLNQEQVINI